MQIFVYNVAIPRTEESNVAILMEKTDRKGDEDAFFDKAFDDLKHRIVCCNCGAAAFDEISYTVCLGERLAHMAAKSHGYTATELIDVDWLFRKNSWPFCQTKACVKHCQKAMHKQRSGPKRFGYDEFMTMKIEASSDPKERFPCDGCARSANKKCAGCQLGHYCSVECQRKSWPYHKKDCVIWANFKDEPTKRTINNGILIIIDEVHKSNFKNTM